MRYNYTNSPIDSEHGSWGVGKTSSSSSAQSATQMGARHSEGMNLSASWLSKDDLSMPASMTIIVQYNRTDTSVHASGTSWRDTSSDSGAKTEHAVSAPEVTFVVYSQKYKFTASYTTFYTQLPTTTSLRYAETATYSVPTAVITTDVAYFKGLLPGALDEPPQSPHGTQKRTIIGSVVGSVCGLLVCAMAAYFLLYRRRQRRKQYSVAREFTHELGRRMEYAADTDEPSERSPPGRRVPQPPAVRAGNARSAPPPEKAAGDPFGDEFAGLTRGPETAALPVSGGDAYFTNRYSYVSSIDDTTTDQHTDHSYSSELDSIPIHLAPNERADRQHMGAATNTASQSFLKEVI
ncbi:AaceriABL135Cp [[Ashbya] aceris (nom. inval.)]|nr:AaceriABL135Cp [[Ashbya] aceris (nom. inval.)]